MNQPDLTQMPALADSAHGHIVDTIKEAKAKLGKLEAAAEKRGSSTQLRPLLAQLRTIDLSPVQESIDQIAADESAAMRLQEMEAESQLLQLRKEREIHERYHLQAKPEALPA